MRPLGGARRALLCLAATLAATPAALLGQRADGTQVELRWSRDRPAVVEAWLRADLDGLLVGLAGVPDVADRIYSLELLRRDGEAAVAAAVERLEGLLLRRIRIRSDGRKLPCRVRFPQRVDADGALASLGGVAVIDAELPPGAASVTFFGSRAFRGIALASHLGAAPETLVLLPGEESRPLALARPPEPRR